MSAVLQQLAERLRASDPSNAREQGEIFERIRTVRTSLEGALPFEDDRRLEAAGMLVAYLEHMGALAGDDVRAIAVRLLSSASDAPAATAGGTNGAAPAAPSFSATELLGEMMLGQILLKRGQVMEEHIHQAMKVQRATSQRMGEILVKIGACTQAQVTEALHHQERLRRVREGAGAIVRQTPVVERNETRGTGLKLVGEVMLGELLIQRNVITRRQLERALEVQKKNGSRIGEALVQIGATTMDHIEQALRIQGRDRRFGASPPQRGEVKR